MAEFRLTRGQLGAPGPRLPLLSTSAKHRVVISWFRRAQLIEFEDALFRTDSAVVLPSAEAPSAEDGPGRRRTVVGIAATCLRHAQEFPAHRVLIAGHADTKGAKAHNEELSRWRARCVTAVLMGDAKTFSKICCDWSRMGVADYEQILQWIHDTRGWDCDPGTIDGQHTGRTQTAVNNFREAYNAVGPGSTWAPRITEWGAANTRETWEAYFNCYEEALAEELGEDAAGVAALRANLQFLVPERHVGCGEHHPRDAENVDEYRSQSNRRVEVLYFEPDEIPAMACHATVEACDPSACELYDKTRFRRRILPPMVSALPWRATWDRKAVHMDETATMQLTAPGLPAGTEMTFEITQVGFGVVAELAIVAGTDMATCPFDAWFQSASVAPVGDLGPGHPFPVIEFTFVVTGGGRRIECTDRLRYADRAWLRLQLEDGTPFVRQPYRIFTPWGSRRGTTDDDGVLDERELPPGGVSVVMGSYTLVHTGDLPRHWEGDDR